LQKYLTVQLALFLAIKDDEKEPVLERLQCGCDRLLRDDGLIQIAPAGIHPTLGQTRLDLLFR
jgi:hypothetical protein